MCGVRCDYFITDVYTLPTFHADRIALNYDYDVFDWTPLATNVLTWNQPHLYPPIQRPTSPPKPIVNTSVYTNKNQIDQEDLHSCAINITPPPISTIAAAH